MPNVMHSFLVSLFFWYGMKNRDISCVIEKKKKYVMFY